MPQVQDRQSQDELYRKISARMQDEQVRKKSTKTWVLPSIAAVAAVLLMMVIGPSFLNFSGGSSDESAGVEEANEEMATMEGEQDSTSLTADEEQAGIASTEESTEFRMATAEVDHLVTENNGMFITLGIPSIEGNTMIPITYMVEEDNTSRLELLERLFDQFPYEQYGLSPTVLTEVSFEEVEGNKVIVTVPSEFTLNGSGQDFAFYDGIQETLRWMNYTEAIVQKEDGSKVELGNIGAIEFIPFSPMTNKGVFLHTSKTGSTYLVPSKPQSRDLNSIEEALDAMKTGIDNFELQPSIPANITLESTNIDEDSLSITFGENEVIQEDPIHALMIKAILLTAKEFGYEDVTFNNTPDELGGLSLVVNDQPNPIPVPLAPNQIDFAITE